MKKTFLSAMAAILVAASAGAEAVKTEAFSLHLPAGFGEFTTQGQQTDSPEGKIETMNWISKSETGEAVVVTVSTMPGPIADAAKAMDGMRESLLKSLGATLENVETIDDGKASNVLFRSAGAFMRSKLAVDGNRMTQVLYVGRSEEQRNAPEVAKLFLSFRDEAAADASTPASPATAAVQ